MAARKHGDGVWVNNPSTIDWGPTKGALMAMPTIKPVAATIVVIGTASADPVSNHTSSPTNESSIIASSPANSHDYAYPLASRHTADPNTGGRYFGAVRSNGRLHAGMDLITPSGTSVIAMTDGNVIDYNVGFYAGTDALIVQNNDGSVVVYGEIRSDLRSGAPIVRGQRIGTVISNNSSGSSMLHIEYYTGSASGSVFGGGDYKRRSDLASPMFIQYLE